MKFYCTKYTLGSNGTIQILDMPYDDGEPYVYYQLKYGQRQYTVDRDAFKTFSDALSNAMERKERKIRSLERTIRKLELMKFDAIAPHPEKDGAP